MNAMNVQEGTKNDGWIYFKVQLKDFALGKPCGVGDQDKVCH